MFKAFCTIFITACSGSVALAQDAGDPEKGEKVFRKCKACHEVGPDAKSKTGPVLNGIVGRDAATYDEFSYSDALVAAGEGGLVWTPEALAEFLEKPKDFVDGTKMTFAGLRKDDERADVIAYLATFN
ncbi:c-type cytochrome [Sulfitobacter sp. BDSS02]|nr:c-type cytochrome [Sulfitobacter sp. BDSS02]MBR9852702.1 cytochrome c family protein [Paracoccaceae bacterium]